MPYCILTPWNTVVAQPVAYQKQRLENSDGRLLSTTDDCKNQLRIPTASRIQAQTMEAGRYLTILEIAIPKIRERSLVGLHFQAVVLLKRLRDLQKRSWLRIGVAHNALEDSP